MEVLKPLRLIIVMRSALHLALLKQGLLPAYRRPALLIWLVREVLPFPSVTRMEIFPRPERLLFQVAVRLRR